MTSSGDLKRDRLILSENFIQRRRVEIDRYFPNVVLYESRPVGEEPKLIRGAIVAKA